MPFASLFSGGVKPDGDGIETSLGGFVPIAEAAGESREKEFWVAIPGEATGVENETFLCFLGIFKHQGKGVEGKCTSSPMTRLISSLILASLW